MDGAIRAREEETRDLSTNTCLYRGGAEAEYGKKHRSAEVNKKRKKPDSESWMLVTKAHSKLFLLGRCFREARQSLTICDTFDNFNSWLAKLGLIGSWFQASML